MAAVKLPAQTLQTLCLFNGTNGAYPNALTLGTDGNFYGTASEGGITNSQPYGLGTVFKVTTNGTLTTLVAFKGTNGVEPFAGLTLGTDGNFYGTTSGGGSSDDGTVFKVTTNGTLTTLVNFNGNGAYPSAALTLGLDGNFYGTTEEGGSSGDGTVFKVTTNGTLTTLASFNFTNGEYPTAALTLGTDGNFYGTIWRGGITNSTSTDGMGTVFKVTTNGTLTTLVSFNGTNGAFPMAGLTLGNDGNFYGTTYGGGISNYGTVFKVTTNGTLTTLVNFNNTNGASPYAALTLGLDGNFYGTTWEGGSSGDGTVFKVTTNGTLTTLVSFNFSNGAAPKGLTLGTDGNFYGTTEVGGITSSFDPNGSGIVFRLLLSPVITSQPQNQAQILGEDAAFIVFASSTSPLAYQWYFSDPALQTTAGATAQMLNGFVYGSIVTNGGSGYTTLPQVQFIGGGGSGASGTATVSNGQVTAITMTNAGAGYTSLPTVLIDPPNGLLIGQTSATLNLNAITTNNFGSYFVVITNFYGSITSSVATLTLAYPPGINTQPQSQFVGAGSGAIFSVTTTGTPPVSLQWWMVAGQLTNATATPLVTNGFVLGATITQAGAGYLAIPTVQFIGGSGSGAGGTAVISNRMVTGINMSNAGSGYTTHPTIQIAAPTAIALTGQTASVLSLAAVANTNAGNYYVVVTNYFGSVTSQVAVLTVELPGYNQITGQLLTNGSLRLSFVGLTGTNYALDRTLNLSPANWVPQATNYANADGVLVFTNIPNKATNNFWRIRKVP